MFSSIASFLPSALHLNPSPDLPRPDINPDTEDEDEHDPAPPPQQSAESEHQPGKGKDKTANETFIFVRPPPSKSNHPLNLQVQLVPPNGRPPTGVPSTTTLNETATTPTSASSTRSSSDGASLGRSNSTRSDASVGNNYGASTTSFSSVASSTASTSARRTIIPLYNLQAHNVLTNVIVDAGTDAKIAKFQKRGIELIDLAFIEPVEVWGEKDKEKDARRESMRLGVDEMGSITSNHGMKGSLPSARGLGSFLQAGSGSRPVTPSAASSSASLHSHSHANLRTSSTSVPPPSSQVPSHSDSPSGTPIHRPVPESQTATPVPPPSNPLKRNIFNKLFNKKSNNSTPAMPPTQEIDSAPSFASFSLHPAPTMNKMTSKDFGRGGRATPPPLPLLQPPVSPTSPSSQTTPTEPQTPRQRDPISPTPTVAPSKEKGHTRNSSLSSAITTPFKTALRSNKDRLSAVVHGDLLMPTSGGSVRDEKTRKRDPSPNPSMTRSNRSQVSLVGSTNAPGSDTGGKGSSTGGYPLMLTQSQAREELTSLKQQQLQLRPPILGIQPSFVSSVPPPSNPPNGGITSPLVAALTPRLSETSESLLQGQRALMYVWLVRKWLKRRPSVIAGAFGDSGFFAGLGAKGKSGHSQEGSSGPPPPPAYGGVEVRFEWKRAKGKDSKGSKKRRRGRRPSGRDASSVNNGGESDDGAPSIRNRTRDRTRERDDVGSAMERVRLDEKRAKRMSTGSFSTNNTLSEEGHESMGGRKLHRERTTDDGDDSDPEDSETPWVCTLKIRRSIPVSDASSMNYMLSPQAGAFNHPLQPQVLRIKVGTLSPTPHHPKVVGMLKVPFPLPDVQIERMGVIKRQGFPIPGQEKPSPQVILPDNEDPSQPYNGITLSAEEIKDMVCSTGLWLVVREGFGGVGRVSRKGDGWRIRA